MFRLLTRWSVQTNLYILAFCAILPAMAVIVSYGLSDYSRARVETSTQATNLVKAMAERQADIAGNTKALLHTLASLPEVRHAKAPAMHALFKDLLSTYPYYDNVSYVDMQGVLVSSSHVVQGQVLAGDRKYFKDAVRTGRFSSGEYVVGRVVKSPIIQFSAPAYDDAGVMRGVLVATVGLRRYDSFLADVILPEKWRAVLLDHQGTRLYRYPKDDRVPIGQPSSAYLWIRIRDADADEGAFNAVGPDGVSLTYAFRRLRLTPEDPPYMTVVVGLPSISLARALTMGIGPGLLLMALVLVLALVTARLLGHSLIGGGLARLAEATGRVADGDLSARAGELAGSREIRELGQAFDQMAGALAREWDERMATEEQLEAAKIQAEAANRAKSEFLANMSHEIRTPLNGLLGMLQLLKVSGLNQDQDEFTDMAIRAGNRLTRLLSDILDLSRIEAGRMALHAQEFRLAETMAAVTETFGGASQAKGLPLLVEMAPDLPDVLVGDEVRIRQVLFNLVGNALKFTEKGEVRVWAGPLAPPGPGRCRVLFIVEDTGIGIPDDKLNILWEPFSQVANKYTRSHQGAGLGLSITRRLVRAMGGTVNIDSEEGRGSTVYLMLPLGLPAAETAAPPPPVQEDDGVCPSLRVLLVEDDDISRLSGQLLVRKLGHQVQTAVHGLDALSALRGQAFDCVLMDVQMDVLDGVEATRRIRADESGDFDPRIPIIAMTAYAMPGDRETFLAAGMDDYVQKPVDAGKLAEALDRVLCRKRARA